MNFHKLLFVFFCAFSNISIAQKTFYRWAKTPPMGWNSYNCFGSTVNEEEVKANADYMAQNLKLFGWEYIVVDYLWYYDNPPKSVLGNNPQLRLTDGSYIPWLQMDEYGRLLPNPNKFPSSFTHKGFKPLADYIHQQGLKFGIHVMRGIPRQAVWAKSKIFGTADIIADMIADTTSTCSWVNHMYGLDMTRKGAQEYLNSILQLYASWGVDYIKVDDISSPYRQAEIEGYRKAIDACGRSIVLSLSPGETPLAKANDVKANANLWRISNDFWDDWTALTRMFDYAEKWQSFSGEGHWPDCDMMQIGKISKRGPVGTERYSNFTADELQTHMTLWCICRSPLMLGGNLPENRDIDKKLITNQEVLEVHKRGREPNEICRKDSCIVWVSTVEGTKNWYVAFFNLNSKEKKVEINFHQLSAKSFFVRDLWHKKDFGKIQDRFAQKLPAHGSMLFEFTE